MIYCKNQFDSDKSLNRKQWECLSKINKKTDTQ